MTYAWHDFVGNIGIVFVLGTYLALTMGKMKSTDVLYSVLNALGAILILVSLYYAFNLSSALIEAAWLLISLFGLWKALISKA